ncbi:SGNH/GDSL hydrolase family protein [Streptomyces sp. NPDC094049]|uniref:SGNH/GDSL hydrolase family protein n=1 Tax=Streptomyces sp. NPDC094049 TaxID=3154987 RepID=UPI00331A8BFA
MKINTPVLALAAVVVSLGLAACGGPAGGTAGTADSRADGRTPVAEPGPKGAKEPGTKDTKPHRLLWMGDSIGEAGAPALKAAVEASGAGFASMASAGGGGVVGEMAAPTWATLTKELASFKPDVVAYQITTYDWGTVTEQRAAYGRLAETVNKAGADLLIVSAPPFRIDDFYKPHTAAIKTAPRSAAAIADEHPDTVRFLDASALWGSDSAADAAQRSKDGIHTCQQGAAAFAGWFGKELGKRYGFAPAAPATWATGAWTGDKVYGPLGCA